MRNRSLPLPNQPTTQRDGAAWFMCQNSKILPARTCSLVLSHKENPSSDFPTFLGWMSYALWGYLPAELKPIVSLLPARFHWKFSSSVGVYVLSWDPLAMEQTYSAITTLPANGFGKNWRLRIHNINSSNKGATDLGLRKTESYFHLENHSCFLKFVNNISGSRK